MLILLYIILYNTNYFAQRYGAAVLTAPPAAVLTAPRAQQSESIIWCVLPLVVSAARVVQESLRWALVSVVVAE